MREALSHDAFCKTKCKKLIACIQDSSVTDLSGRGGNASFRGVRKYRYQGYSSYHLSPLPILKSIAPPPFASDLSDLLVLSCFMLSQCKAPLITHASVVIGAYTVTAPDVAYCFVISVQGQNRKQMDECNKGTKKRPQGWCYDRAGLTLTSSRKQYCMNY